jgi:hypothetical protein
MDATLGARTPLARDTSASPAEPLAADTATTKRLPTAAEVYAGTGSETATVSPSEVDADEAVPAAAAVESLSATEPVEEVSAPAAVAAVPIDDLSRDAAAVPAAEPVAAEPVATEPVATEPIVGAERSGAAASSAGATAGTTTRGIDTEPARSPAVDDTQPPHGRTVNDLADRLDDSRFFSSLFDFTFTNYVTRKLAGPVYVVGLVLIGLGIVVGFTNSLTSAIATHAPIGAFVFLFGVLITLVAAMLSVLLLRVGIEVFCAIIEIAQNTRRRRPPGA